MNSLFIFLIYWNVFVLFYNLGTVFAQLAIPDYALPKEDIEKAIKAKCEKNGGAQAFDNLNVKTY